MDEATIDQELLRRGSGDLICLSLEEKRQILQALQESEQVSENPQIPNSSFGINGDMDEEAAMKAAIQESLSQSTPVESPEIVEVQPTDVRRAPMKQEIATRLSIPKDQLLSQWSTLVSDLRMFDDLEKNRYIQQIRKTCEEIGSEPTTGIFISIILPQGNRISRRWNSDSQASYLYIWCAANEKMSTNLQKLSYNQQNLSTLQNSISKQKSKLSQSKIYFYSLQTSLSFPLANQTIKQNCSTFHLAKLSSQQPIASGVDIWGLGRENKLLGTSILL